MPFTLCDCLSLQPVFKFFAIQPWEPNLSVAVSPHCHEEPRQFHELELQLCELEEEGSLIGDCLFGANVFGTPLTTTVRVM